MPQDPKDLQSRVQNAAPDLLLAFRPMFGGIMSYVDGRPFALLCKAGLGLKMFAEHRAALLACPGAAPLRFAPDHPPSRTYVRVPDAIVADTDELRLWLLRSAANLEPASPARARKRWA